MELVQNLLMYLSLTLAVGFLVKKYFLPKTIKATKKEAIKSCGNNNCGCN